MRIRFWDTHEGKWEQTEEVKILHVAVAPFGLSEDQEGLIHIGVEPEWEVKRITWSGPDCWEMVERERDAECYR